MEMTNGRWMPALATLWPTTCLSEARCFAPKLSTTMLNLDCSALKTSICRKSCIAAPKQKESGSASVYWGAALRNVQNPLIPERNSDIGKSDKDKVLLTMVERKTRNLCVLRLADKSSMSLMEAFRRMEDELGQAFPKVFRSITADNGSENAMLADIESVTGTPVYFTHPYTSCEKGTIENHNGLIRRFLPKGKRVDSYDDDTILSVELWANGLPRKILGYRTPDEAFEAEMDRIFAV